ncbi:hypothetical protein BPAE_0052g00140 [Botrytis paeoniae]|uniref:Uncharacterized protein n=1 Tax=Botrytis paeoniae TaxID=278948 RepID=A0A4Z1FQR1_9HELO|nr:hypothetical protein BPAE_0052g00140 [Botrytis paeoniae]
MAELRGVAASINDSIAPFWKLCVQVPAYFISTKMIVCRVILALVTAIAKEPQTEKYAKLR